MNSKLSRQAKIDMLSDLLWDFLRATGDDKALEQFKQITNGLSNDDTGWIFKQANKEAIAFLEELKKEEEKAQAEYNAIGKVS